MAIEVKKPQTKPAEVAVRVVDSDVHPVPKAGAWLQHVPEPWRSKFWVKKRIGDTINYDAPDYVHAMAMRTDTFPADGGFPGSDPDMAFRQLIVEAGSAIRSLARGPRSPIVAGSAPAG